MKKINIFTSLYSLFFLILGFQAVAQEQHEKQLARADKQFAQYAYIDAREAYLQVVEKGYVTQDIIQKIADSYYFNANLSKASVWYKKLYSNYKPTLEPKYLFRYAQSLKNIENYEKADEIMLEFDKATGSSQNLTERFKNERNYLDQIALQSGRFKINNLQNINTDGSDFGPSFYGDKSIVFASSRGENKISKTIHEWNEAKFLDLFSTDRVSQNSLYVEGVNKLNSKINSKLHESSTVFTKDGNTMYFTRNNLFKKDVKSNADGTILLKLFKAEKGANGKWGNVEELPFNSDEYSVAHPALSVDETKLFFASDMPGTYGMSDLFVVDINSDGSYGEPKNLGDKINTEARETFPYISQSGTLFFASDGHPGLGGLDVFLSLPNEIKISNSLYNEPYNVGEPINSPDDDFSFIIDETSKIGFFSSNRAGGKGDDDVYSLKQIKDLVTTCDQYLVGVVSDAKTNEILKDAVVTLFDDKMHKLEITTSDENGKYELPITCDETYVIRAEKADYEPVEKNFISNGEYGFKHNLPLELEKGAEPLKEVPFKVGDDLAKVLQLNPIYFDYDKSYIRPDAEVELQKVLAVLYEYPTMEIDVRSHTDCRASYGYNESLSDRRAKSTIKYLVEIGGIAQSRISGRGYGESQLVNHCSDGVDCSEEEHQLNRRSEFIILKM